jgi:poly-gamma-glutamate synthesis protein (capsule biosynthesis protein)
MRRRLACLAALAVLPPLVAACGGVEGSDVVQARPEQPPRIDSTLPEWLAPGGRLAVTGWAGPRRRVALRVGGRVAARATAGPRGRYRLAARAPRAGRYRVVVETAAARAHAGTLRVRPLVLAAVGDVNLGDRVARAIAARGPHYPWDGVAPLLRGADLTTANLECAVSTRGEPWPAKEYRFRGSPDALGVAARAAGLDVLTVANNHALDYGRDAFLDTIRHARRAGAAVVGGGADLDAARRPVVLERGGLRVAFLGYSDVRPLGFDAGDGVPGTAPAFPELLGADVRAARRRADLVVVWFHWGVELEPRPRWRQHELAGAALNAGATVVLGAHPHVLQGVSSVPGRRLVAWSLGNFVFPAHSRSTTSTGVLVVHLGSRGVVGHLLRRARIEGVRPRLLRTEGSLRHAANRQGLGEND